MKNKRLSKKKLPLFISEYTSFSDHTYAIKWHYTIFHDGAQAFISWQPTKKIRTLLFRRKVKVGFSMNQVKTKPALSSVQKCHSREKSRVDFPWLPLKSSQIYIQPKYYFVHIKPSRLVHFKPKSWVGVWFFAFFFFWIMFIFASNLSFYTYFVPLISS